MKTNSYTRFRRTLSLSLFALALFAPLAPQKSLAQTVPVTPEPYRVKDHYNKFEARIPMRDGVALHTVIFVPKDQTKTYPIMLERTPYSVPYGEAFPGGLGPSETLMKSGYIFVYQDVRGQFMSDGEFVNMRPIKVNPKGKEIDESTDTYDTIDWLVKSVPYNNGKVGMWGISYPGFYAAAGAVRSHPALKASSPQAPIADWFIGDDVHHNGAFFLMDNFGFSQSFDRPRKHPYKSFGVPGVTPIKIDDVYDFYLGMKNTANSDDKYFKHEIPYWTEVLAHGTYDSYWKERSLPHMMKGVTSAMLFVGGLFDAEDMYGPYALYDAVKTYNPQTPNTLVIGPWPHGGWAGGDRDRFGDILFGTKTAVTYRNEIEAPFFEYYLKGVGTPDPAKAIVFETGDNRWRRFAQWPPANTKPTALYLNADHKLTFTPPTVTTSVDTSSAFDAFVSDPANPVPYSATKSPRRVNTYLIDDQRFAASRPDVLTWVSDPLNKDMTGIGAVKAELFASSTGTDTDFVVKVIDVFPDDAPDMGTVKMGGYEMLVRADILRAKFRNSLSKPEPLVPGKPTSIAFPLRDMAHTWKKGHRIAVQIQGSWFPIADLNPNVFTDIYHAPEAIYHKAEQRVYRTAKLPSHVTISME